MPYELDGGWRCVWASHERRRISRQQVQQQKHTDRRQKHDREGLRQSPRDEDDHASSGSQPQA
jgi:hypothetical protein